MTELALLAVRQFPSLTQLAPGPPQDRAPLSAPNKLSFDIYTLPDAVDTLPIRRVI